MPIFDAHFHIIDFDFPVIGNDGYIPPSYVVADYQQQAQALDIRGGALVSGSFQGFDQTYLCHALAQLGPQFCGVTQLPASTSDEDILALHESGVRALRFNIKRGGSADITQLDYFARRVHALVGWHSELYIDAQLLPDIMTTMINLPAVSIDHLGLSQQGLPHVLKLVDKGVRVKATGFGRVDLDVPQALRSIYDVRPDALLFGTDLPSTRAKRPFQQDDIMLIHEMFDEAAAHKILYANAQAWYFGKVE